MNCIEENLVEENHKILNYNTKESSETNSSESSRSDVLISSENTAENIEGLDVADNKGSQSDDLKAQVSQNHSEITLDHDLNQTLALASTGLAQCDISTGSSSQGLLRTPRAIAILSQVEFYFSIYNLPLDRFLRNLVETNELGYVPIKTICTFNKLRRFNCSEKEIVQVLRTSEKLLQVSDDGLCVRRRSPIVSMKDHERPSYRTRSLIFKGFDAKQDIEQLHSRFVTFLLNIANKQFHMDTTDENGDLIVGRLDARFQREDIAEKKTASFQVVFKDGTISSKFSDYFEKHPCVFDTKKISVFRGNIFYINNLMSITKLVKVTGFSKTVPKFSLAQFFRDLSADILKIEFSRDNVTDPPFVIIRLKYNPSNFIQVINSTTFDIRKYPLRVAVTDGLQSVDDKVPDGPPYHLVAKPIEKDEERSVRVFMISKENLRVAKRKQKNLEKEDAEAKKLKTLIEIEAKFFDHRDLEFL